MRILFFTGSPAGYMAPPSLGEEQIQCGPDWPDEERDGRWVSLRTPLGEYDIAAVLARLPAAQMPDAVVCLVDASWRNVPRNLESFHGPKVLLVADTHHLASPVVRMLAYTNRERFDRVVLLYDRHHLRIFRAAGVKNLHWFPGLTFPHDDRMVQSAVSAKCEPQIAFVGQAAQHHPRRARLLGALEAARVPMIKKQLHQRDALGLYGASLIGFNASLNGDLNLRVFEILASGAMLLTDRLAAESGFGRLWEEASNCVTYTDTNELVERASYYVAHPAEARTIGRAGAHWFTEKFNAERRRQAFNRLVIDGQSLPEFELHPEPPLRISFPSDTAGRRPALEVYESIQELHRVGETIRISVDATVPEDFIDLCRTLPRVWVTRDTACPAGQKIDWRVIDRAHVNGADAIVAPRVWCWNAETNDAASLMARFTSAGFVPVKGSSSIFAQPESDGGPQAANKAAQAITLLERGDPLAALVLARAAFSENPRSVDAIVVLATVAFTANNHVLAGKMIQVGLNVDPREPRLTALATRLPPTEILAR